MVVNSHNIEFGYELLSAVPYAYQLHLEGKLDGTISAAGSEPFYYFSPNHEIDNKKRSWFNTRLAREAGLPYTYIHTPERPELKFPDYKGHYANDKMRWGKPTLCICNRYNVEWSTGPINYFDTKILSWLFENLKDKYEIIYFPVSIPENLQDHAHSMTLQDLEVCRFHGVKTLPSLIGKSTWNETMLRVFANCENFITMNGGYSILASMFSGTNIVYSKPGQPQAQEIDHKSFWRWYPNINNVRTIHAQSYEDLKKWVTSVYIDKDPTMNILVRTHRPNYFRRCMASISSQTYRNINVLAISDSDEGVKGSRGYNVRCVRVHPQPVPTQKPLGGEYGIQFPYNAYLDIAQKLVDGYIMVIDDDDMLLDSGAIFRIIREVSEDKLVIFRADFKELGVKPSKHHICLMDIGSINFCYHSKHRDFTDWTPWKRADYRTAKKLSEHLEIVWIDDILTSVQDRLGMGTKGDLPSQYKITYPDGRIETQCFSENELPGLKLLNLCIEPI